MIAEARPSTALFPHQMDAIKFCLPVLQTSGGAYVQHSPGMGKTLTAIVLARLLKAEKVLVITTKAGLGVWRAEVRRWWPDAASNFTITNYDRLSAPHPGRLASQRWDMLILDEAQKIKNPSAGRSRAVSKIQRSAEFCLLLSGTPAHTPVDYWNQYRMIAPKEWPWSLKYSAYKQLICKLEGPFSQWVTGYKKAEVAQVERAMQPFTHKAVKEELHLPEPLRSVVPVALSQKEQDAYRLMAMRLRVELAQDRESTAPIVLTKLLRLQQITSGFLTDTMGTTHQLGTSKLDVLEDILEERAHQKVVVAYRFTYERDWILGLCVKMKRPCKPIDGSTSDQKRTAYVAEFQMTPEPMVLVLQAQAGGTAITLTSADALIKFSQLSSVVDNTQLEGRVHRIGQEKFVQIIDLIAENSIDGDLKDGLEAKADLVALTSLLRKGIGA
jgi:SNF2 family DNA or RNA helicase